MKKMSKTLGIYVHIPFCEKKCRYCGFLSFDGYDYDMYESYTRALCEEIEGHREKFGSVYSSDTIFIGGGSPSLLTDEQISRIIDSVQKTFDVTPDAEITVESNPDSITYNKLAGYRKAGINRLSMGAQSMDEDILVSLGRIHRSSDVVRAFEQARGAGFENINVDLMFGVPGQSLGDVLKSVEKIAALEPEHISLYGLQLEENTIYYEEYKEGIIDLPDEEYERMMYHEALKMLREECYEHYEISNLCRPGYECRHNLKYWHMEDYLGVGLGAHSYIDGKRSKNVDCMDEYLQLTEEGRTPVDASSMHIDSPEDAMGIYVFTALRTKDGVDLEAFKERFGKEFFSVYRNKEEMVLQYIKDGLMILSGSTLALTENGICVSNDIMSEFVF